MKRHINMKFAKLQPHCTAISVNRKAEILEYYQNIEPGSMSHVFYKTSVIPITRVTSFNNVGHLQ